MGLGLEQHLARQAGMGQRVPGSSWDLHLEYGFFFTCIATHNTCHGTLLAFTPAVGEGGEEMTTDCCPHSHCFSREMKKNLLIFHPMHVSPVSKAEQMHTLLNILGSQ